MDGSHKKSSALSILVQSMAATDVLLALKKMWSTQHMEAARTEKGEDNPKKKLSSY